MSIPKEVILDLLPVYVAGEASPITRAWLEEYLAHDLELAERVRRLQTDSLVPAEPRLPPPELELRALGRTRRMISFLRWLFGLGIAFTAFTFAMEISFQPFKFRFLILDNPALLVPCLAAATVCWTAYFALRRRLRTRLV